MGMQTPCQASITATPSRGNGVRFVARLLAGVAQ